LPKNAPNKEKARSSSPKQAIKRIIDFNLSQNFIAILIIIFASVTFGGLIFDHIRPLPTSPEIKIIPYIESVSEAEAQAPPIDLKQLQIDDILSKMDTRQKVGQLFMFGFNGTTPDDKILRFIRENHIGSVILMRYNISNQAQTVQLTSNLQQIAIDAGHQLPLFIGVDQEGGVVNRVLFLENELYLAQSQLTSNEQAYNIANRRGSALSSLGINMVFAPVLDIVDSSSSFIYARTFRDHAKQGYIQSVSDLSSAMVEGFIDSNVIPVPKHFPGYTNEISDPHNSIPISFATMEKLVETTLPYQTLISTFDNSNFVVMSTPIIYRNIDANTPSLFSTKIQGELLRNTLGFTGVVITDDLRMAALNGYTAEQSAVNSIYGGNDIAMYTTNWIIQERAYNAVLEAVNNGQITEERLNFSVRRIIEAKLGLKE
jgi:beta-N-acetylhexosaminidase